MSGNVSLDYLTYSTLYHVHIPTIVVMSYAMEKSRYAWGLAIGRCISPFSTLKEPAEFVQSKAYMTKIPVPSHYRFTIGRAFRGLQKYI